MGVPGYANELADQLGHFATVGRCFDTRLLCAVGNADTSGNMPTVAEASSRGRVEDKRGSEMEFDKGTPRLQLELNFLLEPQLPLESQGLGGDLQAGASGNPGGRGDHAGLGL